MGSMKHQSTGEFTRRRRERWWGRWEDGCPTRSAWVGRFGWCERCEDLTLCLIHLATPGFAPNGAQKRGMASYSSISKKKVDQRCVWASKSPSISQDPGPFSLPLKSKGAASQCFNVLGSANLGRSWKCPALSFLFSLHIFAWGSKNNINPSAIASFSSQSFRPFWEDMRPAAGHVEESGQCAEPRRKMAEPGSIAQVKKGIAKAMSGGKNDEKWKDVDLTRLT